MDLLLRISWLLFDSYIAGIIKFLCKLVYRKMCRNFRLSRRCDRKSWFFPRGKRSFKGMLSERIYFSRKKNHSKSDQEICIPMAREAMQPIFVTEITRNFPSEIFMPFISARQELGEISLLGDHENSCVSNSQLSMDYEENIADIFAWVYKMDIEEEELPDNVSDLIMSSWKLAPKELWKRGDLPVIIRSTIGRFDDQMIQCRQRKDAVCVGFVKMNKLRRICNQ